MWVVPEIRITQKPNSIHRLHNSFLICLPKACHFPKLPSEHERVVGQQQQARTTSSWDWELQRHPPFLRVQAENQRHTSYGY